MDIKNAVIDNIDKVDFLTSDIASADFILVLGGDGYMLEMIKLYHQHNKPLPKILIFLYFFHTLLLSYFIFSINFE